VAVSLASSRSAVSLWVTRGWSMTSVRIDS
jgi:hypothetical protein